MHIAGSRHFSKLAQDYLTNFEGSAIRAFFAVSPFAGGKELQTIASALVERAATPEAIAARRAVVDSLRNQHGSLGEVTKAVEAHLQLLEKPTTLAVVTGQQVGILGGPLYTIYKAFSAVALANALKSELPGYDIVPIFWQETEDHDLDEVTHFGVFDTNGKYIEVTYPYDDSAKRKQAGSLQITAQEIDALFLELRNLLAFTEFPNFKEYKEWYKAGETFASAQARMLHALAADTGLLILNANTTRIKQAASNLFLKEIQTTPALQDAIHMQSAGLAGHYHTQVDPPPVNLFIVDDGRRYKLEKDLHGFRYDAKQISLRELEALITTTPECISPNVVMRPLFQDTVLPTLAYVAGPGEIAYYAQLKTAYEWAGIPMPLIAPRFSATIVEERTGKNLLKAGGTIEDLIEQGEKHIADLISTDEEVRITSAFDASGNAIDKELESLRHLAVSADKSLDGALTALKGKILTLLKDFAAKTAAAERKKSATLRTQLERSLSTVLPVSTLQERKIGLLYYVNKYGSGFIEGLKNYIMQHPRPNEHFVIEVGEILSKAELPPAKSR